MSCPSFATNVLISPPLRPPSLIFPQNIARPLCATVYLKVLSASGATVDEIREKIEARSSYCIPCERDVEGPASQSHKQGCHPTNRAWATTVVCCAFKADPATYSVKKGATQTINASLESQLMTVLDTPPQSVASIIDSGSEELTKAINVVLHVTGLVYLKITDPNSPPEVRELCNMDPTPVIPLIAHAIENGGTFSARAGISRGRKVRDKVNPYADDVDQKDVEMSEAQQAETETDPQDGAADEDGAESGKAASFGDAGKGLLHMALTEPAEDIGDPHQPDTDTDSEETKRRNGYTKCLKGLVREVLDDISDEPQRVEIKVDKLIPGILAIEAAKATTALHNNLDTNIIRYLRKLCELLTELLTDLAEDRKGQVVSEIVDFLYFPGIDPRDFNYNRNRTTPSELPADLANFASTAVPSPLQPKLRVQELRDTFKTYITTQAAQAVKMRTAYVIGADADADRKVIEGHRDYVLSIKSAAEGIKKTQEELKPDCDRLIKEIGGWLKPVASALNRELNVPMSSLTMSTLRPHLKDLQGLFAEVKALGAVTSRGLSAGKRIPFPQAAEEMWSWFDRREFEAKNKSAARLSSVRPPRKETTQEEMEQAKWAYTHSKDDFEQLDVAVQEKWKALADGYKQAWFKMNKLAMRNLPFEYVRFESCVGKRFDDYHAKVELSPIWIPDYLQNFTVEQVKDKITAAKEIGDAELAGLEPMERLSPLHGLVAFFRINAWIERLNAEAKVYNDEIRVKELGSVEGAGSAEEGNAASPKKPSSAAKRSFGKDYRWDGKDPETGEPRLVHRHGPDHRLARHRETCEKESCTCETQRCDEETCVCHAVRPLCGGEEMEVDDPPPKEKEKNKAEVDKKKLRRYKNLGSVIADNNFRRRFMTIRIAQVRWILAK